MRDDDRSRRRRILLILPYALLVLVGIACVLLIAIMGQQVLGWQTGFQLGSQLNVDYESDPNQPVAPVNATIVARLRATDEFQLTQTVNPAPINTQSSMSPTPNGTILISQVTSTPTPTFTPTPTHTPTPTNTSTNTATNTPTNTPLPTPTFTASNTPTFTPITPTATNTNPPPPPPTVTNTNPPPPPVTPTYTPTNTPTTPPNLPPPAPLTLTVVNTSDTLVSLVWSDESRADSDFLQYHVWYGLSMNGPYNISAGLTTGNALVVSGLASGTTYYFVVRGEDAILQQSGNSPEAAGTTGAIVNPNPNPTNCGAPNAPPDCTNAGPIDGIYSSVYPTQTLILDLGPGNGILDGPGYDLAYYEREADPIPSGFVQMDWITVQLSIDGATWYRAYAWSLGAESLAQNSNVAPYAVNAGVNGDPNYCDLFVGAEVDEVINMAGGAPCPSWGGLWTSRTGYQTGIAIDITGVVPPPVGEGYRYIRILTRGPQPAEIDGIERLN